MSNLKLIHIPKHIRDLSISSNLEDNLRRQYGLRSCRVIKGDTVRVMRGEYSGIEGKVESVNTQSATLAIEGIQREKIRGGKVKVKIHSSNVTILSLNLEDKYRQNMLQLKTSGQSDKKLSKRMRSVRKEKGKIKEKDQ
ncbi:MAG TPA: 50S ribosomal protein L24 [Nitrososphaeraceae archaeon]